MPSSNDDRLRQRARKKLLRVTLPDGRVICHKSATMTFIEVLQSIDSSLFSQIDLELSHLPLLSQEIYPRFKDYMKPVKDGWYVNNQSDTDQKYMQLRSIARQLKIGMEVEVGTDFITSEKKVEQKSHKKDNKLLVKCPDGEYIANDNPVDTYLQTIWKIGVEEIKRKGVSFKDKALVTTVKQYNGQIQVDTNRWLIVPSQTKEKYKLLVFINAVMKSGLEITLI